MNKSFSAMAGYTCLSVNLVGEGEPERLEGASVNADLFDVLGFARRSGRIFTRGDDRPGAPGTVMLSHGLWQTRFGGDPGVLGRKVSARRRPVRGRRGDAGELHVPAARDAGSGRPCGSTRDFEDRTDT